MHRVVWLAGVEADQLAELVLAAEVIPLQTDGRHHITLTFADVDGDGDFVFVGRDGHLRGIDAELEVAAREVVGAQRLQITIELGAGVAVGLGVPAHPAARILVHLLFEGGLTERVGTNDANFADLGRFAFLHRERQIDAIALNGGHRGHHLGAIQTAADVLALEFLLGTIHQRFIKRATIGQAHSAHGLLQCFFVELFGAHKFDVSDGRTLFHHHHQHIDIGL